MAFSTQGGRRPGSSSGKVPGRRLAPTLWLLLVVASVAIPWWVLLSTTSAQQLGILRVLSLAAGLAATSLLAAVFVLPSRLRSFTSHLGLERLMRQHRALALLAVLLVLAHVGFVLANSHQGLAVFDLRVAPPRVWAACVAALALLVMVGLAVTRRSRSPRYEGWRLAHVLLANTVMVATALHMVWQRDLTRYGQGRLWFAGLGVVMVAVTVYRWVWRPLHARRHSYVVHQVVHGLGAVSVVLHAYGHTGVPFRPGQFAWLKIGASPFGFEEHPFTIASTATQPWRKEFAIRPLGDFADSLAGLRPGRRVYLDGPHGNFTLDGLRSSAFVFIAGGVGVTPMLSMLRTMAERGDRRRAVLIVAGRTADTLLHRADHEHLDARLDLHVVEILEEPPQDWRGEVGWLTEAVLGAAIPQHRVPG
ncbi:MAG: ferric reductase-like transmembrane domain-containing protein, partial [Pedococcus sp.]